ncbi:MAG TPA: hypothetical protein VHL31_26290 [Geminicoccus sp.]|jgi:hypothetical protein|uniref:hypothetical protein n=1 Tax=Geminicoccus sp. TaxID=2024832 RepID=UPI002E34581B|nr:hypothetical protein [Geminicoccus sp.]HEX2529787.1 hypothetical protein [Geminicoccus sp.]
MICAQSSPLHVVVDNQHVGLLVRTGDVFRFVAADPAFRLLDGSRFRRLEQVQRAAGAMKRALRETGGRGAPSARDTQH